VGVSSYLSRKNCEDEDLILDEIVGLCSSSLSVPEPVRILPLFSDDDLVAIDEP
jgi:hypothetical protein